MFYITLLWNSHSLPHNSEINVRKKIYYLLVTVKITLFSNHHWKGWYFKSNPFIYLELNVES